MHRTTVFASSGLGIEEKFALYSSLSTCTCGGALGAPRRRGAPDHSALNIVGHSFGGLTARYYARRNWHKVANLVMLGTPNAGSKLADLVCHEIGWGWLNFPDALVFRSVQEAARSKLGECKRGNAIYEMQRNEMEDFNEYPDPAGIRYFVYGGTKCESGLEGALCGIHGEENDTFVATTSVFALRLAPAPLRMSDSTRRRRFADVTNRWRSMC